MSDDSDLVLVCAVRGRDGELAAQLLNRHGLRAAEVQSIDAMIPRIAEVGAAVITAESLTRHTRAALGKALAQQPPWSDFPIVLFAPRGADRAEEALEAVSLLGNLTILERPVHSGTLVSAVVAALRGRRRQYEAREAIHRRDQFLAMLGHELRNPLASIMLALETLPPAHGGGSKQLAIIERQAHHLHRLVDDLLDVARVTSGKVRLQTAPVDLHDVVQRCANSAELAASARHIKLRTDLTRERLCVDGDLVRLEEVFNNLLSNALKYSPDGASVEIVTRREGGECVVIVRDTGIGIRPDMLERVFELFAQVDATIDRSQGGLGIGLTLVRALVDLHGGSIHAHSDGLGRGSTFTVRFPALEQPMPAAEPAGAFAVPRQLRVVLVDDNLDVLEMTKELLETLGCTVVTAPDGPSGLAQLLADSPDIAFVDIGLPGIDGYEIARRVRDRSRTSPTLVAMTGYGQPEDRQRALAAGFDHHLTKPVTASALKRALALGTLPLS